MKCHITIPARDMVQQSTFLRVGDFSQRPVEYDQLEWRNALGQQRIQIFVDTSDFETASLVQDRVHDVADHFAVVDRAAREQQRLDASFWCRPCRCGLVAQHTPCQGRDAGRQAEGDNNRGDSDPGW